MFPFAADESPYILMLRNWPAWLPLVLGGVAVYLLLPRPRPFPVWAGALAGVIALALAGAHWFRPVGLTPESVLFYAFSALAVLSGSLLVTQQNPARAALSFTLVVLSTCGLFLLLAAPFLMAATIIVYAGAIIVTFLFVIMLAQQQGHSDADARSREPALAVLTGFLLLAVLLHVVRLSHDQAMEAVAVGRPAVEERLKTAEELIRETEEFEKSGRELPRGGGGGDSDIEAKVTKFLTNIGDAERKARAENLSEIGDAAKVMQGLRAILIEVKEQEAKRLEVLGREAKEAQLAARFARPGVPEGAMSGLSGTPANTKAEDLRRDPETGLPRMPADNAAHLGKSLFTDYLLPVELGGFLLLVATVGAIAIAQRKGPEQHGPPAEGQP